MPVAARKMSAALRVEGRLKSRTANSDGGIVLGEGLQAALPGPPEPEGDEGEAQQEEARQDQEGEDAQVGARPVLAHDVDGEQEEEQEGA